LLNEFGGSIPAWKEKFLTELASLCHVDKLDAAVEGDGWECHSINGDVVALFPPLKEPILPETELVYLYSSECEGDSPDFGYTADGQIIQGQMIEYV